MSRFIKQIHSTGDDLIFKPDNRKLIGFDVAWVEKWENFKLSTLIVLFFFLSLSRIGVTDHPSELKLTKVNATAYQPFINLDFFPCGRART